MQECNLKKSKDELKELAKRDTNDFLREAADAPKEFRALMDGATPFYKLMIDRMPPKENPTFETLLADVFEIIKNSGQIIQQNVLDIIAKKEKIKPSLLLKMFRKEQLISFSQQDTKNLNLVRMLVPYYSMGEGMPISSTPQKPLFEIVEIIVTKLIEHGYKFIFDESTHTTFMVNEKGTFMSMEISNPVFFKWAFSVMGISTPNREPVKDLVLGTISTVSDKAHAKHVKSMNFFDFAVTKDGFVAIFPTGNISQDIIVVRPSIDGKTPNVVIVSNGNNVDGFSVYPSPLHETPITYLGNDSTIEGMKKLKEFLYDAQALHSRDKMRSFTHKMQILLPAPTKRKMRKANRGQNGSGKTTDGDIFAAFVYGESKSGTFSTQKELWICAHQNLLQIIDNWEGVKKKLQEEFALLHATGGHLQDRELYSNNKMRNYFARSQIIETAIEGFTSAESKQREQEYIFSSDYKDSDFFLSTAEVEVKKYRDIMWSAYLNALSLKVLPNYGELVKKYEIYLSKKSHPKSRFNDFIARQALMIDLVRDFWSTKESTTDILDAWVQQWINESEGTDFESDAAVQRLEIIFTSGSDKVIAFKNKLKDGVTSNELHTMFCAVEKEFGLPRAYSSPSVLGQRLKNTADIWNKSFGECVEGKRKKLNTFCFLYDDNNGGS